MAVMSGAPQLVTQTFTSNATWVASASTTVLVSVTGEGQDGAASSIEGTVRDVVAVNYRTTPSTGSGNATWDNLQGLAEAVASDVNADGSASYTGYDIDVWPDGSNTVRTYSATITDAIPGSATAEFTEGWESSGPITASGRARVLFDIGAGAITGANATGFNKTFPGGAGGPASPVTYENVPVTPNASYSLLIPPGGSITITYYK